MAAASFSLLPMKACWRRRACDRPRARVVSMSLWPLVRLVLPRGHGLMVCGQGGHHPSIQAYGVIMAVMEGFRDATADGREAPCVALVALSTPPETTTPTGVSHNGHGTTHRETISSHDRPYLIP